MKFSVLANLESAKKMVGILYLFVYILYLYRPAYWSTRVVIKSAFYHDMHT